MTVQPSTAPAEGASSDAETRGKTTLADRVVEKIAARAAAEVPHCLGLHRRVVGITTGRTAVTADAVTDGAITGLSLSVAIAYPAPIISTTRQVRTHVRHRVENLCGLTVDHVDITVADVIRPERKEQRVV
ncbi:MAG: Asp23/Gls24 family envelope stress response protein [Actinomycetota bacterium]|nr:Asp23/Gls24 family envelope stress response protein [Actinomycetota bacterium]